MLSLRPAQHHMLGTHASTPSTRRLLASLRHPHIARFYEAFVEQGSLNVVMELMPGGDLAACIR